MHNFKYVSVSIHRLYIVALYFTVLLMFFSFVLGKQSFDFGISFMVPTPCLRNPYGMSFYTILHVLKFDGAHCRALNYFYRAFFFFRLLSV